MNKLSPALALALVTLFAPACTTTEKTAAPASLIAQETGALNAPKVCGAQKPSCASPDPDCCQVSAPAQARQAPLISKNST